MIDRITNRARYTINGKEKQNNQYPTLTNQSKIFVPFIEMENAGDTVEILVNLWKMIEGY